MGLLVKVWVELRAGEAPQREQNWRPVHTYLPEGTKERVVTAKRESGFVEGTVVSGFKRTVTDGTR